MPFTCCVPGCRGNYSSGPKVGTHRFPKDELLRKRWVVAIRRKDFNVTKHSSVCELHFKRTDFETETSAYDPKTGKTLTAPLSVKRLKKGVIPSILPTTSPSISNRETPSEKRKRLETKQLALALQESLKSAPEENFQLEITTEANITSPALRPPGNEKVVEMKKKMVGRKRKSDASETSSKKVNDRPSSNFAEQYHTNSTQEVPENKSTDKNQVSGSSQNSLPGVYIKEEPQWETAYNFSTDTSRNNPENSAAENVQIISVRSLHPEDNVAEICSSEEENTISKPEENFDSTFYTKPLSIDQRDKAFGSFIACEMSDLHENPELYMKTKQCILKILTEAHFEQMSSGNKKLTSNSITNLNSNGIVSQS